MRKIVYATQDYRPSSLPCNRKDLYRDVYAHSWRKILLSGLFLALSFLPLILFVFFMDLGRMGMNETNYSSADLREVLLLWDLLKNGGVVLLYFIALLGLAGFFRVEKLLLWQEGVDVVYDFGKGIRENYPYLALFWGLFGAFFLLADVLGELFLVNWVSLLPVLAVFLCFLPLLLWLAPLVSTYRARSSEYLKNSAFFFLKSVPLTYGGVLLVLAPFLIDYFLGTVTLLLAFLKAGFAFALCLFALPALLLLFECYAFHQFDRYLNQEHYPEYFRKGLYNPKEK